MNTFYIAALSICLSVAAQFALKFGMASEPVRQTLLQPLSIKTLGKILFNPAVLSGFFLYGVGAIVWLAVLNRWDVSKAYPMVGFGFALTLVVGFFLNEQISISRVAGVLLICGGIALISRT